MARAAAGRLTDLTCFGSLDWGFNSPGVMLWWLCLPDGAYHILREYKFQRQNADQVKRQIHQITKELGLTLRYVACDPAMWQKTGAGKGESIAETLGKSPFRLPVRKSDNDRFNGWLRVHEFLSPMADGQRPFLTVDPSCRYLRRTIPAMVQDTHDPDDLDTNKDDHAVDALRYGAMSRPRPQVFVQTPTVPVGSLAWWRQHHDARGVGVLA